MLNDVIERLILDEHAIISTAPCFRTSALTSFILLLIRTDVVSSTVFLRLGGAAQRCGRSRHLARIIINGHRRDRAQVVKLIHRRHAPAVGAGSEKDRGLDRIAWRVDRSSLRAD